jgi:hypothetical protein
MSITMVIDGDLIGTVELEAAVKTGKWPDDSGDIIIINSASVMGVKQIAMKIGLHNSITQLLRAPSFDVKLTTPRAPVWQNDKPWLRRKKGR